MTQIIIFTILFSILFTSVIMSLVYTKLIKPIIKQNETLLFLLHKAQKDIRSIQNDVEDLNYNFGNVYGYMKSLSNNVQTYLNQEQDRRSQFIMPTPEMTKTIEATIREQILIEANLSKNLRIPPNLTEIITTNVKRTYPNIDEEYLCKKILCKIEEFNETARNE